MFIWCANSATRIMSNTRPEKGYNNNIVIDTGINMVSAFQICLRSDSTAFKITSVNTKDLPEGVEFNYHHVENLVFNDGVPYPDKLTSITEKTVPSNTTHIIWIRFDTKENVKEGNHNFNITVNIDDSQFTVNVSLNVYPVRLQSPGCPQSFAHEYFINPFCYFPMSGSNAKPPVTPFYSYNRYSEQWWDLITEYAKVMKYMRINILHLPILYLLRDGGSYRKEDGWYFNFELTDRFIEHMLKHGAFSGITIHAIITPVSGEYIESIDPDGKPCRFKIFEKDADLWAEAFYGEIYKHFKEKGWLSMLRMHLQDEPHSSQYWIWAKEMCRKYMPGVICGEPLDTHSISTELSGDCDLYIPRLEVYEQGIEYYKNRQATGDELWCYSCCLPEEHWWLNKFIDLPHHYSRLIKWACFSQGITGFLHWGFNFWDGDMYGISPNARFKGDGFIVYPDAENNSLLLSVRGLATIEGIQEWELLNMLKAYQEDAALEISKNIASSFSRYTDDPDKIDKAKKLILIKLTSFINEEQK